MTTPTTDPSIEDVLSFLDETISSTMMTTPVTSEFPLQDIHDRLRHLRAVETAKYQITNYAASSRTIDAREQTLRQLYHFADQLNTHVNENCFNGAVMSTAGFVFDRYLSSFGRRVDIPSQLGTIGAACLWIAAKSLIQRGDCQYFEQVCNSDLTTLYSMGVEMKILKALNWDVVYLRGRK